MRACALRVVASGALAIIACIACIACVGDEPEITTTTPTANDASAVDVVTDALATDPPDATGDTDTPTPPPCDPAAPFGTPVPLEELNTEQTESNLSLTDDELTAYFRRGAEVWTATRQHRTDPFKGLKKANVPSSTGLLDPYVTRDGSGLYFASERDSPGTWQIYFAARSGTTFNTPTRVTGVVNAINPTIDAPRSAAYWTDVGNGGYRLMMGVVASPTTWTNPTVIAELRTDAGISNDDLSPVLSPTALEIYFASKRETGNADVFVSTRGTTAAPWSKPMRLPNISTTDDDNPAWISSDGCRLYVTTIKAGRGNLFVATRSPT